MNKKLMVENNFAKAIEFAYNAHNGTYRKGTTTPYIVHPVEAMQIATTLTDDEEVIIASLLHDVVEDTNFTKEDIEKLFGKRVANLVSSDTEDKMEHLPSSSTWEIRKRATLDFLDGASKEEQIICLSDKLSNMRAIYRDYKVLGDTLWERFNQKDKNKHAWYYGEIAKKLKFLSSTPALEEYDELINKVFYE